MDNWINAIKYHAGRMDEQRSAPHWGIVTSVDPSVPAVKVQLQPEDLGTGWIPIAQVAAAGGWGVMTVPTPGMQAFLVPVLGDGRSYVAVGFTHSTQALPPKPANVNGSGGTQSSEQVSLVAGETVLMHSKGTVLRLCDDGSVYIRPGNGTVYLDGTLNVNGPINAEMTITSKQEVVDKAGLPGCLSVLRHAYNIHTAIDTRGDADLPPTPQVPE